MSAVLVRRVYDYGECFTGPQKAVMLALAWDAIDDGWFAILPDKKIAEMTGFALPTVKRIMGQLARAPFQAADGRQMSEYHALTIVRCDRHACHARHLPHARHIRIDYLPGEPPRERGEWAVLPGGKQKKQRA